MTTSRWEKERASWLLARSRPGSSGRRRAEVLARRARRLNRGGSGVSKTSIREDITPSLPRRMLTTDQGHKEQLARLVMVPALFVLIGLLIGPAMLIAATLYGVLWGRSPKIGRLLAWPWFAAGALLGFIGIVVQTVMGHGLGIELTPPLNIVVYLRVAGPIWLWTQTTLGLLLTGVQIAWSGWAAVKPGSALKPEKDKDGNFIATPDHKKVKLDPLANATSAATADRTATKTTGKVKLAAFTADSMASEPAPLEEIPTETGPPDDDEMYEDAPEASESTVDESDMTKEQTHV